MEGFRGEPRQKPPFPTTNGLFDQPTAINNPETLLNVLDIVNDGGAAYAAIGTEGSSGSKLFCLSGNVARPGLYEVDFGSIRLVNYDGDAVGHRLGDHHAASARKEQAIACAVVAFESLRNAPGEVHVR